MSHNSHYTGNITVATDINNIYEQVAILRMNLEPLDTSIGHEDNTVDISIDGDTKLDVFPFLSKFARVLTDDGYAVKGEVFRDGEASDDVERWMFENGSEVTLTRRSTYATDREMKDAVNLAYGEGPDAVFAALRDLMFG